MKGAAENELLHEKGIHRGRSLPTTFVYHTHMKPFIIYAY